MLFIAYRLTYLVDRLHTRLAGGWVALGVQVCEACELAADLRTDGYSPWAVHWRILRFVGPVNYALAQLHHWLCRWSRYEERRCARSWGGLAWLPTPVVFPDDDIPF